MRKLHWLPSEERDTLPALESVILLLALIGIGIIVWVIDKLF